MSTEKTTDALSTFDRALGETEIGFFTELKRLWDVADETCIPAIVKKYDRKTHIATVVPLVKRIFETTSGKIAKNMPEIDVPILNFNHGGFAIDAPVFSGDPGYVVACNRNARGAQKKNSEAVEEDVSEKDVGEAPQNPDTYDTKKYAFGFFIPCSWAESEISEEEDGNLVIKGVGKKADGNKWGRIIVSRDGTITFDNPEHGIRISLSGVEASRVLSVIGKRRKAVIDPDADLKDSDAKFREVVILTGLKESSNGKVKLSAKKVRVLADIPTDAPAIEFEVGSGGENKKLKLRYGTGEIVEYDGSEEAEFNVPAPPNPPVTSVDKKANTKGLSVNPTTGDVKIENTGVVGIKTDQSDSNKSISIEKVQGKDVDGYETGEVKVNVPLLEFVQNEDAASVIDAISAKKTIAGDQQKQHYGVKMSIDKSKANCSLFLGTAELAKFFGNGNATIPLREIVAGPGISISVQNNQILISATGSQQISGFTGTKYVVTGSTYDKSTHYWANVYAKVVYSNGLVTQWVDDFKTENVTQAVQETV